MLFSEHGIPQKSTSNNYLLLWTILEPYIFLPNGAISSPIMYRISGFDLVVCVCVRVWGRGEEKKSPPPPPPHKLSIFPPKFSWLISSPREQG